MAGLAGLVFLMWTLSATPGLPLPTLVVDIYRQNNYELKVTYSENVPEGIDEVTVVAGEDLVDVSECGIESKCV